MAVKIILDAGHGGFDNGASYMGRAEKDDALRLALAVGEKLEQDGYDVCFTRTTDVYQSPYEKAELANQSQGQYLISFHRNSGVEDNLYRGVQSLIYEENVLRFTGQMSYASHINPWWYNVQTVLSGFLPYTLLALFGVCCWRGRKRAGGLRFPGFGTLVRRWRDRLRKQPPARLFAWTCVAVVFLFYCIPASKRSVYLLPLYPFLAYGLAEFFLWISRERPRALAAFGWVVSVMAFVLALAFVAVRAGWVTDAIFQGRHAAENAAFLHALRDVPLSPLALLLVVLPVLAALWCLRRQRRGACVFASVGVVFAVHLALSGFYLPTVLTVQSDRAIAERIAAIAPRGTVYSWRTDVLEANRLHPFTINFYLGDRVIPIDKAPALPRAGYLIAGNDDVEAFRRAYPQYAVRLVFDSGHRSCDDHKVVRFYTFSAADRP